MKLFIKQIIALWVLLYFQHTQADFVRIYHSSGKSKLAIALKIKRNLQLKYAIKDNIGVHLTDNPCEIVPARSFIDFCINKNGELKIIRSTKHYKKSLAALAKKNEVIDL